MAELKRADEWPGVFDERGHGVLADPTLCGERFFSHDWRACNAPYIVNGVEVGYCSTLVNPTVKKGKHAAHRGEHVVKFKRPGEE